MANDHVGPGTSLLVNYEQVQRAIANAMTKQITPDEMLVVEFCDTIGSDGLYRKYSCFCVDGNVLPRHMIASQRWALRMPDLVTAELQQEERAFLEGNPHEEQVRRVFEIAKIGYGRIDYAVVGDRIAVWEINCNPYVMMPVEKYKPLQLPNQHWFAPRMKELFERLMQPLQA
jgi:hypothetical protein